MHLQQYIQEIYPLDQANFELLSGIVTEVTFPKGHQLFKSERTANHIYIVKKGLVRASKWTEDDEITFWFGMEGAIIISMYGYIKTTTSYEDIYLLEDTMLYKINGEPLQQLYETNLQIANWGRKLAEYELLKTEERLISRQIKSAKERYLQLIQDFPALLQRVPLGYIASYLGITQVSLSRIRNDIR